MHIRDCILYYVIYNAYCHHVIPNVSSSSSSKLSARLRLSITTAPSLSALATYLQAAYKSDNRAIWNRQHAVSVHIQQYVHMCIRTYV